MKQKLFAIARNLQIHILMYRTYHSESGVQVYNITYSVGKQRFDFSDGYFVGSGEKEKQKVIDQFRKELVSKI